MSVKSQKSALIPILVLLGIYYAFAVTEARAQSSAVLKPLIDCIEKKHPESISQKHQVLLAGKGVMKDQGIVSGLYLYTDHSIHFFVLPKSKSKHIVYRLEWTDENGHQQQLRLEYDRGSYQIGSYRMPAFNSEYFQLQGTEALGDPLALKPLSERCNDMKAGPLQATSSIPTINIPAKKAQ